MLPWVAAAAVLLAADKAGGTWVDTSGNLLWLFKKPEDRQLADFASVQPDPIQAGGAPGESTLHR